MPKKSKLATPEWIVKGYDSLEEYNKENGMEKKKKDVKTFKIRKCPECGSEDVGLVLSESDSEEGGGKEWECYKCKWSGSEIKKEELNEEEFMKYMDRNSKEDKE